MGDHDVISTEDGFVVCRCGRTFTDNTTEEAEARQRRHHKAELIDKPGAAAARRALEGEH